MDDVLVYGKSAVEHEDRLGKALRTKEKAGMTLNKVKCQFPQNSVLFLALTIHLSTFTPNLAETTRPLRDLLIKNTEWVWEHPSRNPMKKSNRLLLPIGYLVFHLFDTYVLHR